MLALMLLGAVGLVLLLGCANLASLLLVRGSERQRELAVRAAMGAGRMSLVRQMLIDSLMLGVAGGALGTLLALCGRDALVASFPEELPYWLRVDLDWRVVSFVGIVSLAASVLFGLLPALAVSRFALVTMGIALGLVLSLGISRLIESALYNVVAFNVTLCAGATGLLALAVLSPNYLPARRAARAPPMAALRLE